jgi:predicted MPP superfamily phosphohydrolase
MRRKRALLIAALGGTLLTAATAASQATAARVRTSYHQVPLLGTGRIRVVHLTDLHVGRATSWRLLAQVEDAVRAARPDLVVMTGDYVNHSLRFLPELDRFLAQLPCPCVATLGNHDHWSGADPVRRALEARGVRVLSNSHLVLRAGGQTLTVVGVDDGRSGHADLDRAFAGVPDPGRALVLTHFPATADAIVTRGGRLILAGHTHGGQIGVPRLTAALARLGGTRYLSGWYSVGPGRLYVSTGIGSAVFRLRLGRTAVPEVAVIDLL